MIIFHTNKMQAYSKKICHVNVTCSTLNINISWTWHFTGLVLLYLFFVCIGVYYRLIQVWYTASILNKQNGAAVGMPGSINKSSVTFDFNKTTFKPVLIKFHLWTMSFMELLLECRFIFSIYLCLMLLMAPILLFIN